MTATTTLQIDDLIEETFDNLYRHGGRPAELTVGATALTSATDTSLTLSGEVSVTDRIEFTDGEICLVTGKSSDTDPVYTVTRGYEGTTASTSGHATGARLYRNPVWSRHQVDRWVRRFFDRPAAVYLPNLEVQALQREEGLQHILLDQDTIRVTEVQGYSSITGKLMSLGRWKTSRVPTSFTASGLILRLPMSITDADEVWVTVHKPYTITSEQVVFPTIGRDLPALWAAAYGVLRREVDRGELDRMVEWSQEQANRAGVNLRLVRELWGEFYRNMDEARKLYDVPKHRPFIKMPRMW